LNISLDADNTKTLHEAKPDSKDIDLEAILISAKDIKSMSNGQCNVEAGYVITKQNYQGIVEAAKKVRDYGFDRIRYRIDFTDEEVSKKHGEEIMKYLRDVEKISTGSFEIIHSNTDQEISSSDRKQLSSSGEGLKCFTSELWICIGSNGDVYPCGHCVSPETPSYGNILDNSLKEILGSEQRKNSINNLPLSSCNFCSPFSLTTNKFLTYLSELEGMERDKLLKKEI